MVYFLQALRDHDYADMMICGRCDGMMAPDSAWAEVSKKRHDHD